MCPIEGIRNWTTNFCVSKFISFNYIQKVIRLFYRIALIRTIRWVDTEKVFSATMRTLGFKCDMRSTLLLSLSQIWHRICTVLNYKHLFVRYARSMRTKSRSTQTPTASIASHRDRSKNEMVQLTFTGLRSLTDAGKEKRRDWNRM